MSRIDCGKVKGEDYILTENDKIEIAEKVVPNASAEAISLLDGYYGFEGQDRKSVV